MLASAAQASATDFAILLEASFACGTMATARYNRQVRAAIPPAFAFFAGFSLPALLSATA